MRPREKGGLQSESSAKAIKTAVFLHTSGIDLTILNIFIKSSLKTTEASNTIAHLHGGPIGGDFAWFRHTLTYV